MVLYNKKKLGNVLLEAGVVTQEQLEYALSLQKISRDKLGKILIQCGFLSEHEFMELMEKQLDIPYVNLNEIEVIPEVATSIPFDLARRHQVIPIKKEGSRLILAMVDPLNVVALDSVTMVTGLEVQAVIAGESDISNLIDQFYGLKESIEKAVDREKVYKHLKKDEMILKERGKEEEPIIRVVDSFINRALKEGASDIHIEPQDDGMIIRLRVDGLLHNLISPPKILQHQLISRIKIMANLDISEKRLPQDGRLLFQKGDKVLNIRVSSLPTIFGEKLVLRLLDRDKIIIPLDMLGFSAKNYSLFKRFITSARGMILVTGPTGCGKSTTLYSTLNQLNVKEKNIITVEEPVEYNIKGINQVQVNGKIGLTFARALRTILRQDPNIIMVGEIRDLETAQIATRAALTGHLVFSTLHTNDAVGAVVRLLDMGVEGFLITSSLVGVIAQRLIRKLCPYCQIEYRPSLEEWELFYSFYGETGEVKFFEGRGCRRCNQTGYRGRTGIHEIMPFTEEVKRLVLDNPSSEAIRQWFQSSGYVTLQEDGLKRAVEGVTSLKEIVKVAFGQF
ncbi:GspE/PulE family protein [Candidatus Contubernalis alkaliaceticus]|uniref:GspE/PulE family protein n=1 Tax=Candidatus Contubernalis alkaliaceticus TaxID=338645 RepID=UPI001F4C388A|nr:GspE/PulE family protein [Candidatus Contubernalis alkalaceticus]UNC92573.1 Flp pilus assembly complex ATPase component TadA [Candidatus Contubernalis alkalaceticus]